MDEPSEHQMPGPPKSVGDVVTFIGGRSGKPITATRASADLIVLTDPEHPNYRGNLLQVGRDVYELQPTTGPGMGALGGVGLDWEFLIENF